MQATRYGEMDVVVYGSERLMGKAAASDLARILNDAIASRGEASVILATGNSQDAFVTALVKINTIDWSKISVFHMDEYLGISENHPASFRRWMRERLVDVVHPGTFYGLDGDAPDVEAEMSRYERLLEEHEPVACVLGIGENGHLAFNDPPADFTTDRALHVITLAEASRRQQVSEGHFETIEDVPAEAITLTVPALLRPAHVLAVVPESRKATAVRAALEGPITPELPASLLRTLPHVKLYLDPESSALLDGVA
jgi:glucosamine-6-phosphate deaminase